MLTYSLICNIWISTKQKRKRNCQNKEKRKLYKKWTATVKVKLKFDTTQLIYSKLKFEIKPFVLKERKEADL